MRSIRIVTWNSTGESAAKATELRDEINTLNTAYPFSPVGIILNQEGWNAANGAIYNMLNDPGAGGVGLGYFRPPAHLPEHIGGGGDGYTVLGQHTMRRDVRPFQLIDYTLDPVLHAWYDQLPPGGKRIVDNHVANFRPPAFMEFAYMGDTVRLITWHAPLARSTLLTGCTTTGGAPLDAFLLLERSSLIEDVAGIDLVIIAGDLNMTAADLDEGCPVDDDDEYQPLKDFTRVSNHVDHIMAWRPAGPPVTYFETRVQAASGDHDILSCRVQW